MSSPAATEDTYGDDNLVDVEGEGRILDDDGDDYGDIPEMTATGGTSSKRCRRGLMFGGAMVVVFALLIVLIQTNYRGEQEHAARGTVIDDAPVTNNPQSSDYQQQGCSFGDRLDNQGQGGNKAKLYKGQYICSENRTNDDMEQHRYQFGINPHGDLIVNDVLTDLSVSDGYHQVFFLNPRFEDMVEGGYYFYLDTDGTFVVQNGDTPAWTLKPLSDVPMVPSKHCFDGHDCPSLHMRADGDLNIVYMNDKQEVKFRSVHAVYHLPPPNNHSLEPQNGRNGGSNKHEHPDDGDDQTQQGDDDI